MSKAMIDRGVVGTIEILGALFDASLADREGFKSSPKDYIYSRLDYSIGDDISVSVVENSVGEVHLSLPYYGAIETCINSLSDNDLDNISGGDIFTAIIIGSLAGFVGIGVAAGAVTIGVEASQK